MERAVHEMATLPTAFGLDVRYSLKACPTGAIVRIFDQLGCLFDASSVWEVMRAVHAGVSPDRILLTAQETTFDDALVGLISAGLELDASSVRQLELYGQHFPGQAASVRFNPGFGSGLVNRLTSGGPNSSFGTWIGLVDEVAEVVERHDLRLRRMHVHIGSSHSPDTLVRAAGVLLDLARRFETVDTINLGGGYKIQSVSTDPVWDHPAWAAKVAAEMDRFAQETGRKLRLELEPGTYLMGNSGSIVTRVTDVVSTGPDGHEFVKIDGGLTEILRPSYYGAPHPLVVVPAEPRDDTTTGRFVVAGHCCIAGDVLTTVPGDVEHLEPRLLLRPRPGDLLVIERGGGYCSSMSMKNFNSFPEAPEVLRRKDGSFALIRRRQTFEQLIQNELSGPLEVGHPQPDPVLASQGARPAP